ncbi:MAG: 2OG-Fe(II) oxygenase [Limisphaerales bacterium]
MSSLLPAALDAAASAQDLAVLQRAYREQDEFAVVEKFLPPGVVEQWTRELETLKPHIHRNFIPRHKKGGSVAFDTVDALAPSITGVYRDPRFKQFLSAIAGAPMNECPATDPHRCAMYAYTEEGDHIGWHYDTSYYKDRRWTVLVGLVDRSSSKLLCDLHTKQAGRPVEKREMTVDPGTLVLFNGDKVWHCVTPTKPGEERYIISMQYVTTGDMNPFMRFVSNMKDAIAYFGFKGVFLGGAKKKPASTGAR